MRLSFVGLAVALSLPACGRSDLDLPGMPGPGEEASTETVEASVDAAMDVTVGHAADAATDPGVDAATEAAMDAPEDLAPEADVAVDAADAADVADAPDGTGGPVCAWGGFAPAVIYPEGSPSSEHPTYVAMGDFDRDGHLDFVATDAGQTASVYINRGDGTFAPQVTYAIGAWTNTVVTGDFNGDGWLDVAAANGLPECGRTCCGNTCNTTVAVLINRGDGTFLPAAFYDSGGAFASGLAVGDMNGDHHLDFVATNYNSNTFAVIHGHGDGTFGAPVTYPVAYPDTVAVADLDGNGALDVIVGLRSLYPSSIETFFNDGTGALTTGATYDYGTSQTDGYYTASSIVVGDLDGKKHMDVVVADTISGDVIRYPNPGNGVFGTPAVFDTLARPGPLALADFNRDGKLDVATSVYVIPPDGGADDSLALVLLGDGQGGFSSPLTYDDLLPWGITAGDVNGDGYPDLVTGNDSWVTVLLSQCGADSGSRRPRRRALVLGGCPSGSSCSRWSTTAATTRP